MHRIWSIPELVDLTFDFLAIRDAAAAATVCRSFWLTALAHIWRDIDDFSNLLNLLPKIPLFPCYGSDVLVGHLPFEKTHQLTETCSKRHSPRKDVYKSRNGSGSSFTQSTPRVSRFSSTTRLWKPFCDSSPACHARRSSLICRLRS